MSIIQAITEELADAMADRRELAKPLFYAKGDIVRISTDKKTYAKKSRKVVATHYAGTEGKCFWIGDDQWNKGMKKAGIRFPGDFVVFIPYGDAVKATTTPEQYRAYQEAKKRVNSLKEALVAANEAEKGVTSGA